MRKLINISIASLLFSLNWVSPVQAAPTYYLAFQGPLTGTEAFVGQSQLTGVQFAIKKFNNTYPGFNVQLITFDDQGDPSVASMISPSITKYPEIIGMIGASYSRSSIASLPSYKAVGLPMISPTAALASLTNPASTEFGGPVFHRLATPAGAEGRALANWATQDVKSPNVFLVDDQTQYGDSLCQDTIAELRKISGVNIVGSSSNQENQFDFSPVIAKLKASNANVVIHCAYATQTGRFVRQLRESGSNIIFASGEASHSEEFIKLSGNAASSAARIVGVPSLAEVNPKLEKELQDSMGRSSGLYSVAAMDATNIFLDGLVNGMNTRSEMLNFLKSFKGTSANGNSISFTSNGDLNGKSLFNFYVKDDAYLLFGASITGPIASSPWVDPAVYEALKQLNERQRISLEEMTTLVLQLNSKVSDYVKLLDEAVKKSEIAESSYSVGVIKISELAKLLVEKDAELLALKALNSQVQKNADESQLAIVDLKKGLAAANSENENLRKLIPVTISCVKAKTIKKVTAVNPKCPAGYKKQ